MSIMRPPRICFIIPYFGQWPFWFPFFLESCRRNTDIDWLLYSDAPPPDSLPGNVKIIGTSFTDYCRRVSDSLRISFSPVNPYKLCDIKPALGYIHHEELREYDFWAFGDLDLVYGNLRQYFTAERLSKNDIFSTHHRRISGHCCLIRNTRKMREAFMSARDWAALLSRPEHVTFDESAFSRLFIRHKNWPHWLAKIAKPLNTWTRHTENIEAFSTPNAGLAWTNGSRNFPENWYWKEGVLTNDRDGAREFPYFHFMVWKQSEWKAEETAGKKNAIETASTGHWRIAKTGFHRLV